MCPDVFHGFNLVNFILHPVVGPGPSSLGAQQRIRLWRVVGVSQCAGATGRATCRATGYDSMGGALVHDSFLE